MIANRDGIVGAWKAPLSRQVPLPLREEDEDNLMLLGRGERSAIFDFELLSQLGFQATGPATARTMSILVRGRNARVSDLPLISLKRPTHEIFLDQLDLVEAYADLRDDRAQEIVSQLGVPAAFFGSIAYLHADRMPWTMELIHTVLRFAYAVTMRLKHAFACRRPHEYSPQIQPMIACPLHTSWPSGHATEGYLFARILLELLKDTKGDGSLMHLWANQLMRQASRIAVNRTVAGLHFPVDSAAGALLGLTLAEYLIGLCTDETKYFVSRFDGTKYPTKGKQRGISTDFNWEEFYDADSQHFRISGDASSYAKIERPHPFGEKPVALQWLWTKAKTEWDARPSPGPAERRSNGRRRG
jgi:hypothetical protein